MPPNGQSLTCTAQANTVSSMATSVEHGHLRREAQIKELSDLHLA
jgi:hypothetical protein